LINAVKRNDYPNAKNIINQYSFNNYIDNVDSRGWSALHWACYLGYEPIVALLLDHNASLNAKTINGLEDEPEYANKTAKEIADSRKHKACIKMIYICAFKRGCLEACNYVVPVANIIAAVALG